METLKQQKLINGDELHDRIEHIQTLKESELESYRLVKDQTTGEHYLHYAYIHIDVSGSGEQEQYHHLLPLDHDDVISLSLQEEFIEYPVDWKHAYLRSGPDGNYVWFDPQYADDFDEHERLAKQIQEKLLQFKKQGNFDIEETEKLLEEIEQLKSRLDEFDK